MAALALALGLKHRRDKKLIPKVAITRCTDARMRVVEVFPESTLQDQMHGRVSFCACLLCAWCGDRVAKSCYFLHFERLAPRLHSAAFPPTRKCIFDRQDGPLGTLTKGSDSVNTVESLQAR